MVQLFQLQYVYVSFSSFVEYVVYVLKCMKSKMMKRDMTIMSGSFLTWDDSIALNALILSVQRDKKKIILRYSYCTDDGTLQLDRRRKKKHSFCARWLLFSVVTAAHFQVHTMSHRCETRNEIHIQCNFLNWMLEHISVRWWCGFCHIFFHDSYTILIAVLNSMSCNLNKCFSLFLILFISFNF